jgi:hypothetical protein
VEFYLFQFNCFNYSVVVMFFLNYSFRNATCSQCTVNLSGISPQAIQVRLWTHFHLRKLLVPILIQGSRNNNVWLNDVIIIQRAGNISTQHINTIYAWLKYSNMSVELPGILMRIILNLWQIGMKEKRMCYCTGRYWLSTGTVSHQTFGLYAILYTLLLCTVVHIPVPVRSIPELLPTLRIEKSACIIFTDPINKK